MSRSNFPKQFLRLASDKSMLQDTLLRLDGLNEAAISLAGTVLVCNKEHRFLVASQLQELSADAVKETRLILEPEGRNTAPALTLAALIAQQNGADPILLAMPADHVLTDKAAFQQAVEAALPLAADGAVVTFGIVPHAAETGYGYIECAEQKRGAAKLIKSFVEKPDAITAQQYLGSGRHYWNSGLFMVAASVWLRAIQKYQPAIYAACHAAMESATHDCDFIRPELNAFLSSPSDSIDYAVMEHLPADAEAGIAACVLPLDAGWSDLGAWDALWDVLPRDEHGNALVGNALQSDCQNSLLFSKGRLIAGVGLDNVMVVDTPDALLVAHKDSAQDVKKIVAMLKNAELALVDGHRKVHRPWGWYDSIDRGERFQVKRIVVNPGASLSLQMHHHRAEHWVVVKGTAEVTNGDQVILLTENQSTYIPLGHTHRLANPGIVPLEIIEVQSGSYLGEDDIVRFEDTYGRGPGEAVAP